MNLSDTINALITAMAAGTGVPEANLKYLGSDIPHRTSEPLGVFLPQTLGIQSTQDVSRIEFQLAFYSESYDTIYGDISVFIEAAHRTFGTRNGAQCVSIDANGGTASVKIVEPFRLSRPEAYAEQSSVSRARHFKILIQTTFEVTLSS